MGKKAAVHLRTVIMGMLFIGFTVQILLGMVWMCLNFRQVQDFEEPSSALYRGIRLLTGGVPQIMYLLQLGAGFFAGYYFLGKMQKCVEGDACEGQTAAMTGKLSGERPQRAGSDQEGGRGRFSGRFWRVWMTLALLTCPFAMQCHLALLPCSFMGSLFLLLPASLLQIFHRGQEASAGVEAGRRAIAAVGNRRMFRGALAAACVVLSLLLSGAVDVTGVEKTGRSIEAALASRFAWPTIWNDRGSWTEDLQQIAGGVLWETSYAPDNMELLERAIEEQTDPEQAKSCYRQIAEVGWRNHASMVIRQIGWDALGYAVTPIILPLQLEGEAYDSYTGRNYEVMRGNSPVLTRVYVNYSCWWFVVAMVMTLVSVALRFPEDGRGSLRRRALPILLCLICSGILVGILTMRGAGIMDYKDSIAVNQLWLAWMLAGGIRFRTRNRGAGSV